MRNCRGRLYQRGWPQGSRGPRLCRLLLPNRALRAACVVTTSTEKRELIVVAGPNGSGKSILAYEYLDEHPAIYLGVDEMAFKIAPADPTSARLSAGREYFRA